MSDAIKVLNICQADWANFAYENMRALRTIGINCDSIKLEPHKYYSAESDIAQSSDDILLRMQQYNVIQFFHDHTSLFIHLSSGMHGKKVICYHTSSYYRANFNAVNSVMNPYVHKSVCAMPEFIGKGSKDEIYMVGAVDTDFLLPEMFPVKHQFAHYPSNPNVKGSHRLIETMNGMDVDFHYSLGNVSYDRQIKRMSECEIYIEMLTEKDGNGSPYGNFGITGLEAAALGKVVITQNNINDYVYDKYYGFCAFNFAKDAAKLKRHVETFSNYSGSYLRGQQQITREWVVKNHSLEATGKYWLKKVYE